VKRIQFLIVGSAVLLAAVMVQGQATQGQSSQGQAAQGQGNQTPPSQPQGSPNDEIRVVSEPYTPVPTGAIRVQSNIVEVGVVVRDERGKPVHGLTKDDFLVLDSGRQQQISNFTVEEDKPSAPAAPAPLALKAAPAPIIVPPSRYIGFYFDDINMKAGDLTFARQAAEKFVNTSMAEGDKVAVFTSSATPSQSFTADKQKLIAVMEQVRSHYRGTTNGAGSCPHIEPYQAWQIMQNEGIHSPAFDLAFEQALQCGTCDPAPANRPICTNLVTMQASMTLSLANQFALDTLGVLGDVIRYVGQMPGRRTLIMTSSGYLSMTDQVKKQQDKLIDSALHAGIRINTLDAKGLTADWLGGDPTNGPPIVLDNLYLNAYADEVAEDERDVSDDSMAIIANGTGGTFFHNDNDLTGGVRQMAAVPEVSYDLGFSPVDLKPDGAYHTLKVKLANNKGYTIDARPGYYAPTKASLAPQERLEQLNKEVMAANALQGIPTGVETNIVSLATGEPALRITIHVDLRTLPFKKENARHVERLIFITALFDQKDKYLSGVVGVMDMNLKDETRKALDARGATSIVTLQAPPGSYRIREVVQEVVTGRIASSNTPVVIH
jgi:VWFA-related protein